MNRPGKPIIVFGKNKKLLQEMLEHFSNSFGRKNHDVAENLKQ